jgi:hypothetical protein
MLEGWKLNSQINEEVNYIPERAPCQYFSLVAWHYLDPNNLLQVLHFQLAGLLHKNAVIFNTCRGPCPRMAMFAFLAQCESRC